MVLGEQASPVSCVVAAPETRNTRSFSLTISLTASATDEVGTSTITSTSSTSIHWRTMLEPTSGLFWWSAESTSIGGAADAAADVLDRHARGLDRALPGEIGIQAGLVVHHADLDGVARDLRLGGAAQQGDGAHAGAQDSDAHASPSLVAAAGQCPTRRGTRAACPCCHQACRCRSCQRCARAPSGSGGRPRSRRSRNSARPAAP